MQLDIHRERERTVHEEYETIEHCGRIKRSKKETQRRTVQNKNNEKGNVSCYQIMINYSRCQDLSLRG